MSQTSDVPNTLEEAAELATRIASAGSSITSSPTNTEDTGLLSLSKASETTADDITIDEYDQFDTGIKKEPLPPKDDKILPSPEQKVTKVLPTPTTMTEAASNILNPKVVGSVPSPRSSSPNSLNDLESGTFKPVRGRPKIVLCSRCKTFVSKDKTPFHTKERCDSIIRRRESNRGHRTSTRKRRVNPEFIKDFRRLKRENATAVAAAHAAVKKINQLKKKMSKKKLKSLPKEVRNMFSFLEKKFSK